ncbi:gustatory receptor 38 [Tribolium castaneum]|uniref:Gustatory receptor n=1 Tax=Tribolium castaneum TaxID=7070 RepID=D2A4G8_TRICA|nr:PREDICTED: gustatory and pheromone receptor 39a, isoform B-like [Tribolium castaneum]EFA05764.1 gustatory receptor 38 [Tribolium castaneum]|eukprot:XP_015836228.1 PREDICTED: gustatory and pheromone receptor 39a, isoform B-like [Tribolium castaneum]
MTTSQLHLFFKVGNVLAIMPQNNTLGKVYTILIFTLLFAGAIYSTIERNYDYFFMKNVFLYTNDVIFVCLNFYVTIIITFWKRKQWKMFWEKFNMSYKLTQTYDNRRDYPFTIFLISHVIFFAVGVYNACVWYGIEGITMIKKFGIRRMENYIHFFYSLFLTITLGMLLTRYKKLNTILNSYVTKKLRFYDSTSRKMSYIVCHLKDTVNIFNDLYGWPLFFIIYQTLLQFLIYLYFMITNEESFEVIVVQMSLISITLCMTVSLILTCSKVVQESYKLVSLTYKLRWAVTENIQKQELYEFTNLVVVNLPKFTAADFFEIDKNTILQIFATVNTLLVILIQMGQVNVTSSHRKIRE